MINEEENIYKNLFEYPTKIIAELSKENDELKEKIIKKIIKLEQKIDKAIEYIRSMDFEYENGHLDDEWIECKTLDDRFFYMNMKNGEKLPYEVQPK